MIGLNVPAEAVRLVTATDPLLAIVHDDFSNPLAPFAGLNVVLWRPMSPHSQLYHALPPNAHIVGANEFDEDWPQWYPAWAQEVRANRPDITIHHPASSVNGEHMPTPETLAACDVYDVHVPSWATQKDTLEWFQALAPGWTKPWWVTEVEVPPDAPEQFALLMDAARACLAAGAEHAFLWGADYNFPDVLHHPDILAEVRQFNSNGGTTMADTLEDRVAALEQRDSLIADALYDLAQMQTADAPDGHLLQDAKTKINALNPGLFTFP